MRAAAWSRAKEAFAGAVELAPEARSRFLDETCPDAEVRAEVERLLHLDATPPGLLDRDSSDLAFRALTSLSEPEPEPPSWIGERLGPWQLEAEIGRGGMGIVYEASRVDGRIEGRVAVKVVREELASLETLERFRLERHLLSRLDHPNIARILDAGRAHGLPFFVLERVEGEPLGRYCANRKTELPECLRLFRKVCAAVQYAHQNLVLHRDLKPRNILVTESGEPKLLDFGIGKLLEADGSGATTRPWRRRLTPAYASPEMLAEGRATTASDVYSLGVLLYELLTGSQPFGPDANADRAASPPTPSDRIRSGESAVGPAAASYAPLTAAPRHLARDLDRVVFKALAFDPAERYPSADALGEDLARCLDGRPIRARKPTLVYRTAKLVRRHPLSAAAAAVAAIAAIAATLLSLRLADSLASERRQRERAEEISSFLETLFEHADPRQAGSEGVTVREVVEAGRRRLAELDDRPLLQATLMDTLGKAELNLGRLDEAEELLSSALEMRRRHLDPRHPEVAESLDHLSRLRRARGDYPDAAALAHESLDLRIEALGENHPKVAESRSSLGAVAVQVGQLEDAADHYRQALDIRRRAFGAEHERVAESLSNLGVVLVRLGRTEEAERSFADSAEIYRRALGEGHVNRATALSNRGLALRALGRLDEAEDILIKAVAAHRLALGDEHPTVAAVLRGLALVRADLGDLEGAAGMVEEALAVDLARFGPDHPTVAEDLHHLGTYLTAAGQPARALEHLQRALAIREASLPPEHPRLAAVLGALGAALTDLGRAAQARPLLERALGALDPPRLARSRAAVENALGACLDALGDARGAARLLSASSAELLRHYGEDHYATRRARERQQRLCRALDVSAERCAEELETLAAGSSPALNERGADP